MGETNGGQLGLMEMGGWMNQQGGGKEEDAFLKATKLEQRLQVSRA